MINTRASKMERELVTTK